MSNQERKILSQRQKIQMLIENVGSLAKANQELVTNINEAFGNFSRQLAEAVETLNAVVAVIGVEKVAEAVETERKTKAQETADRQKAMVKSLLDSGAIEPTETVKGTPKTLLVAVELDKDGKEIHPGYAQIMFSKLKPELQGDFVGKAVGFAKELPGGSLKLTAIYEYTEPKPKVEDSQNVKVVSAEKAEATVTSGIPPAQDMVPA